MIFKTVFVCKIERKNSHLP